MHKSKKKLAVARETIRCLDDLRLRDVVGGQTKLTCSDICPDSDGGCVDTLFVQGCVDPTFHC
jgi:hypothetical protein